MNVWLVLLELTQSPSGLLSLDLTATAFFLLMANLFYFFLSLYETDRVLYR